MKNKHPHPLPPPHPLRPAVSTCPPRSRGPLKKPSVLVGKNKCPAMKTKTYRTSQWKWVGGKMSKWEKIRPLNGRANLSLPWTPSTFYGRHRCHSPPFPPQVYGVDSPAPSLRCWLPRPIVGVGFIACIVCVLYCIVGSCFLTPPHPTP